MFFLFLALCSLVFGKSLDEIKSSKVIRIGVYDGQPPFSKFENNEFVGFEIDLANKIAQAVFAPESGAIEFVTVSPEDRMKFLAENKVDLIIANYTRTDERAKYVDFSMPYFAVNIGVLTKKSDRLKSLTDLKDKVVLCSESSTADDFFSSKGYKVKYCDTASKCYMMLKLGEGDAYAADNIVALTFPVIDQDLEVNIKNLGSADFLAIGVQKGNSELLNFLNLQLINLSKEGFFKKAFEETLDVYFKGTAEKKYFLLDDVYSIFG